MAKSQLRSNKEAKKPKQEKKAAAPATSTFAKGIAAGSDAPKKKG